MNYKIKNEKVVFDDHYKMLQADVTYDSFDAGSISTSRLAFDRGDSVAILLLEKDTQSILFTNQFRYPTCKNDKGWLMEIPAGSLQKDETPKDCIIREVMEELGYGIKNPTLISTFYSSPGASTERIFLYYSEVSTNDKTEEGGGNSEENEDIQVVKVPVSKIISKIAEMKDAKAILALQWYLLHKMTT